MLDKIKEARKIIEDPSRWTKGTLARDATGAITRVFADDAASFCAVGAIARTGVSCQLQVDIGREFFPHIQRRGYCKISGFNDSHSHEEVLELFDEVIRRLESCDGTPRS
jgi:hypothetical protein